MICVKKQLLVCEKKIMVDNYYKTLHNFIKQLSKKESFWGFEIYSFSFLKWQACEFFNQN